jgi:hypothetical protein
MEHFNNGWKTNAGERGYRTLHPLDEAGKSATGVTFGAATRKA